jgi:hypothetical protein
MQSPSIKAFLALVAVSGLLVEASPFNVLPLRRHDQLERRAKGTGTGTKATSAAGTGMATGTATSAQSTATSALNATALDCQITVRVSIDLST